MDYVVIAIGLLSGLLFHLWLFIRISRWMDRDQAMSLAGNNPTRYRWILCQLQEAKRRNIPRAALFRWLAERERVMVQRCPHQAAAGSFVFNPQRSFREPDAP